MNLVKKLFLGLFISSLVAPTFYAYSPDLDETSCSPVDTGTPGASSSSDNDEKGGPIPG